MAEIRKATHDLNGMTSQDTQGQRIRPIARALSNRKMMFWRCGSR